MPLSWIDYEEETLIPPYTSITMLKEETENSVKHYEVEVAFDNKGSYGGINCPILGDDSETRIDNYIEKIKENNNNNNEREVHIPTTDNLSHNPEEDKDLELSDEDSLSTNQYRSNKSMIYYPNGKTQSQPRTGVNTPKKKRYKKDKKEYSKAGDSEVFWLNFKLI